MEKNTIRKIILKRRKEYNSQISSALVLKEIIDNKLIDSYTKIGIYFPIRNEIDITKLKEVYKDKMFYLPKTKENLEFALYDSNLIDGPFNTKEPTTNSILRDEIECFLIPCVGITSNNIRIGYGKGYYDRYLDGYKGKKIGICYKDDSDLECEADTFDLQVDMKVLG